MKYQTVLITGASGGIGLELAHVCASHGHDVVIVARSKEKLDDLAKELKKTYGIQVYSILSDLSGEHAAETLYEEIQKRHLQIDILINNAGFATNGFFTEIPWTEERKEMQVNILTLTELCKLFGADMVQRGSGRILNVASTAAYYPGPLMAVYYASKAYVLSLSYSLAEEMKRSGVSVSVLCPGPTKTGFAHRAGIEHTLLFRMMVMSAQRVAREAYQGMMNGKQRIIPGTRNKLQAALSGVLPSSYIAGMIMRIQKR